MTDLLAVILGNTTAVLAAACRDAFSDPVRAPPDRLDDLRDELAQAGRGRSGKAIPVIVASVNPPALERFRQLAADVLRAPPLVAGEDFPIPIRCEAKPPERVGADRLLAALAAHHRAKGACVAVDFGTAITVNAVRADGAFLGGAIFPGLAMMARALAEGTALLPEISPSEHAPAVGTNTQEAISAGIIRGTAGAVAALIQEMRQTVGSGAPVFLTGGTAPWIAPHLSPDCRRIFPNLVLEGLVLAYRQSRPQ